MSHHIKPNGNPSTNNNISGLIEYTIIRPECSVEEIRIGCVSAREKGCHSICVPPYYVQHAARFLTESSVKINTMIGFPMGYSTTYAKVEEMKRAFIDGVDQIDAVINICAVKNGDWNYVKNDIDTMASMTRMRNKVIKIVFEVDLLNEEEAQKLCDICIESGVDFVVTSTGINGAGNQPGIVKFLRDYLPDNIKIKAAGGINNEGEAKALLNAGAIRLGIVEGSTLLES